MWIKGIGGGDWDDGWVDINAGKKGPRTKNIPGWRLWRVRYVTSGQTSLPLQQQTPKPTASQQGLRLLLSGEIRNAINELYGRSKIPGGRFSRLSGPRNTAL